MIREVIIAVSIEVPSLIYGLIILEKFGRIPSLIANFSGLTISTFLCTILRVNNYFIYFASAVKFFCASNFLVIYSYTSEYYPTKIRATGFG